MKSKIALIGIFLCLYQYSVGQAKQRKLSTNINHPAINTFAPYVSLDGNSLVYIADVGEDNALTMNYTTRAGVNWKDPVTMPKSVNNRLNFLKGYSLSPDGKTLYISNSKSNGMGGFDLYTSQLNGRVWSDPVNMLLPANSSGHEACPSVSLDGSKMFYMRCEKMDFNTAEGCKLMVMTKKSNGRWDEPIELPSHINTGNSQTPRIMGDGELLVFSSDRLQPNKGGMDLYATRFINGTWSKPQALDFANSPDDDQYISATSSGMYLLKALKGQHTSELVEILFPPELRPKGTLKIEGNVTGPAELSSPFITVYDLSDQHRVFSTKPGADGTFTVYMNYGGIYDLSVEPEKDNFTFFSKKFDLQGDNLSMLEKVDVTLLPVNAGTLLELNEITFTPNTSVIAESSNQDLRRLTRMIEGNADLAFSIEVTLMGYEIDSVQSKSDLTEVLRDTLIIPITYIIPPAPLDSIAVDSIGIYSPAMNAATTATRDSTFVRIRYHNDRTLVQAKALENYLIKQGVSPNRLASSGRAVAEAVMEKRKTMVHIIVH